MPFSSNQVSFLTHARTWARFFLGTRLGPYHEMSAPIVTNLLRLGNLTARDHVVDIGCGDGRILLAAARMAPGCRATGIELDPVVAELCRKNVAAASDVDQTLIHVHEGDARKARNIDEATLVTLYLSERGNASLRPLLQPLLLSRPTEARVVSFLFPMSGWEPAKTELDKDSGIPMYLFDATSLPASVRLQYEQAKQARMEREAEEAAGSSAPSTSKDAA
jgi:SAM-dependent methyltransferase